MSVRLRVQRIVRSLLLMIVRYRGAKDCETTGAKDCETPGVKDCETTGAKDCEIPGCEGV